MLRMRVPLPDPVDRVLRAAPATKGNSLVAGGRAPEGEHGTSVPTCRQSCFVYFEVTAAPEAQQDATSFRAATEKGGIGADALKSCFSE